MTDSQTERMVDNLTDQFRKYIANGDSDLASQYQKYVEYLIESILNTSLPHIKKDEETIRYMLQVDFKQLKEMSIDKIRNKIIKDLAYEQIEKISAEIYFSAKKVFKGERIETDTINRLSQELESSKKQLKDVREAFRNNAEKLVSEAILDLHYITHPGTDTTSLRLGRYILDYEKYVN